MVNEGDLDLGLDLAVDYAEFRLVEVKWKAGYLEEIIAGWPTGEVGTGVCDLL